MEWPPSQPAGMRRACVPSWGWMCRDAPSFTERVRNRSPSRPAGSECFCLRPSCPAPGPWPLLAQLDSHLLWLLLASSPPCFLHSYYRLPKLLALSSLNWFSAKPLFVPLLRPLWAVPGASAPPPPAQPRAPPPPLRPAPPRPSAAPGPVAGLLPPSCCGAPPCAWLPGSRLQGYPATLPGSASSSRLPFLTVPAGRVEEGLGPPGEMVRASSSLVLCFHCWLIPLSPSPASLAAARPRPLVAPAL